MSGPDSQHSRAMEHAGRAPLAWEVISPQRGVDEAVSHAHANQRLLADILLLEDSGREDGNEPINESDAERLERKVDLLIDLVGRLNARLFETPAPADFRLTPDQLIWWSADVPPTGATVRVSLHLNPAHPGALVLSGVAMESEPASATLALHDPGQIARETLERFIFVHHRRHIAALRTR